MTIGATVRAAAAMGVCAATLLGAGCGSEGTDAASTQRAAAGCWEARSGRQLGSISLGTYH